MTNEELDIQRKLEVLQHAEKIGEVQFRAYSRVEQPHLRPMVV